METVTGTDAVDDLRVGIVVSTYNDFVTNKLLEEGSSVTLRFHFYDDGGVELGTQDVSVPAPPVDVAQQFQLSIDTDRAVMGYSYEVVS